MPKPKPQIEKLAPTKLLVNAPAKINLNLHVGPLREDGFHPLDSIVAKIALYDAVELQLRDDDEITFACEGFDCGDNSQNLAYRAAKGLRGNRKIHGCDICLSKKIPPGGGLGGGSSDAAAVLLGLNELWGLGLSGSELLPIAAELGSDVPLFLASRSCRMTSRGEEISPTDVHDFWAVLILPNISCPTGSVYGAFDAAGKSQLAPQLDAKFFAKPVSQWRDLMVNDLTRPAMGLFTQLAEIYQAIASCVELPLCMSGSGSTLFVLCDSESEAADVVGKIPDEFRSTARIVQSNPW
ncbi:MAG: 4-(cytidine 5'-diphospho)-2-C-methyl-D-erythritol kinase [Phycisphaerae bacterium]|nr:4-(cytidine 5'-diphospho)-2-C-methyl-D-erythritol kinase [Phycisphaerae bacterium]